MRQALWHYYHLEVTEIREVYPNITLIVTKDGRYALKKTKDAHIDWVCHYIQSLHLDAFVPVLLTAENHYCFSWKEDYFYLMPWLDFEGEMVEELKLRNYFKKISVLHNETFFVSKIQEGYFTRQIEEMQEQLLKRKQFYESLMCVSERCDYKAPWHWQMILLYPKIMNCFHRCHDLMSQYEACVKEKKTCRLCFTYNHFDLHHYCFSQDLLISLEGCCFQRPTSDIYAIYNKLADHYLDFENVESFYLNHFTLYDDEKLWLAVYICLVPTFVIRNDALEMCWMLERVSRYLEMSEKITKRLGFC